MVTWGCECQRYFIETEEKTKNGKAKTMAIDVRAMHVVGDFLFTKRYKVNLVKRKTGNLYCVKQLKGPKKEKWPTLKLLVVKEEKWEKEGTYTREAFIVWLGKRVVNAVGAVVELETCPPDNIAA